MTALQQVNLGTAPAGTDGDPVRTAFVKQNANTTVIATQTTLTSQSPNAVRDLVAADMGTRVNFTPTVASASHFPNASTAGADQVVAVHNIGTADITMAVATGSGDTAPAVVVVKPGEMLTWETDGASIWRLIDRKKSVNETVQGDLAVLGALSVTKAASFTVRPAFAGNTPWDSGNFNPATFTGRLLGVTTLTATGRYVRNPNLSFAIMRIAGAGGAGGGCAATSSTTCSSGGGGGAGGFIEFMLTAAQIDAVADASGLLMTIGAAGVPASGAVGGTGGNTSIGNTANASAICVCTGGSGGPTATGGTAQSQGGAPGSPSLTVGTKLLAMNGQPGSSSALSTVGAGFTVGNGGSGPLGAGGRGTAAAVGLSGSGFGGGGGGAVIGTSQAAIAGGVAAPGGIVIFELA